MSRLDRVRVQGKQGERVQEGAIRSQMTGVPTRVALGLGDYTPLGNYSITRPSNMGRCMVTYVISLSWQLCKRIFREDPMVDGNDSVST